MAFTSATSLPSRTPTGEVGGRFRRRWRSFLEDDPRRQVAVALFRLRDPPATVRSTRAAPTERMGQAGSVFRFLPGIGLEADEAASSLVEGPTQVTAEPETVPVGEVSASDRTHPGRLTTLRLASPLGAALVHPGLNPAGDRPRHPRSNHEGRSPRGSTCCFRRGRERRARKGRDALAGRRSERTELAPGLSRRAKHVSG